MKDYATLNELHDKLLDRGEKFEPLEKLKLMAYSCCGDENIQDSETNYKFVADNNMLMPRTLNYKDSKIVGKVSRKKY